MIISESLKEEFKHKTKHDFQVRLNTLHEYDTERVNACVNGRLDSDHYFLKKLGMEREYQQLAEFYNPDNYEWAYDPDAAYFHMVRKAVNE